MKKRIVTVLLAAVLAVGALTGCGNKDMWDTVYTFDYAVIQLPNGEVVEGRVESWTDYEDGDQIQVKIDGITYLISILNCTLIAE